jgi:hypothetical protein
MNKPVMIVGRRTNLDIEKVKVESWEDVVRKSYYLGARFRYDALDYFIVNRNFPWDEIPKFVIGRVCLNLFVFRQSLQVCSLKSVSSRNYQRW